MIKEIVNRILISIFGISVVLSAIAFFLYLPRIVAYLRPEKSITILAWPTILDASYLKDFEQQTGIRVYLSYFESNEELYAKLLTTNGRGYDLIMPSDYTVDLLIKKGLLKRIDSSRLAFWHELYSEFLGHYHDPKNEYTVPYFWGIYGLGVDIDYFGGTLPPATWKLIFDPQVVPECIGLLDDIREHVLIAAKYLFGSIDELDDEKLQKIKNLLIQQKQWVEMYTNERTGYLLVSKTCPVVTSTTGDIVRVMRHFKNIYFMIPEEGSFIVIDSFAMPKESEKEEFVYAFLNYLYQADVLGKYVNKFGFFPTTKSVTPPFTGKGVVMPSPELFKKLDFFRNVVPLDKLIDLFIALKA